MPASHCRACCVLLALALPSVASIYTSQYSSQTAAWGSGSVGYGVVRRIPPSGGPLRAIRGGADTAGKAQGSVDDFAAAMSYKDVGVQLWRESKFTESAAEFEKAVIRLPHTAAALPERVNCINNWAACMIKLDRPEEAADLCTQTLELDPANKKARLRRGLACEALDLSAKAGADMVLLLSEDAELKQAKECLGRCMTASPTLRSDVVTEITAVLARIDPQSSEDTAARILAAHELAENVFVITMGFAPTELSAGEGPANSPHKVVEAAAVASAGAGVAAEERAAAVAEEAAAEEAAAQEAAAEEAAAEEAAAEGAAEAEAAEVADVVAARAAAAAAVAADDAAKAAVHAAAAAATAAAEEAAADIEVFSSDVEEEPSMLEPERPGESLRDAFARRLAAGGKDGKTASQQVAQIEWDLVQLEARTDALNQRVPQVLEYSHTLPAPSKRSSPTTNVASISSTAMSQLAELRRKRQGQLPLAQPTAEAAAGTLRAGALGQGDEWGQCMRQLETMTKQAIDYSELGTMLLVRLDGISERASRAQEQEPMLQDAVDAEDAAAVLQRRRSVVRKVQALVQLTDTNREQLLTRLEKLRPPVAVPAKMAGGVGKAWRKLVDSGMIKGVVIAGVALGGWQAAASAGGMEMLALLSVHSALNALDLAGEEARRYQRAWFPSLEQHRASRSVGVQAWEAEEASFTSAVVRWKRDSRRYERDCLKAEQAETSSMPFWKRAHKTAGRPPPPPPPRRMAPVAQDLQSGYRGPPPPGMGKLGDEGMRKALSS